MKQLNSCTHIDTFDHIVIFFCNGIGDAFMTMPAIRALREIFTKKITLVCPESHENWWYDELMLDEVIPISFDLFEHHIEFDINELSQKVFNVNVVVSLLTCESDCLNQLLDLWEPACSLGLIGPYDFMVRNYKEMNMFNACFEIIRLMNASLVINDFSYPIKAPPHADHTAKTLLKTFFGDGKKVFILHMETKQNKMWPNNNLQKLLIQFLLEFSNYNVILLGQKQISLPDNTQQRIIPFFGFDLSLASALISYSDIFLGVDSCMLHLADLAKIPSVGLFGPTNHQRFGFCFTRHTHISSPNNTMDMSVEEVLREVRTIISSTFTNKQEEM